MRNSLKYIILSVAVAMCFLDATAQQYAAMECFGVRYRQAYYPADSSAKPALVIYLHGRSGSGEDNNRQLKAGGVEDISNFLRRSGMTAYLVVPQCPTTHEWVAGKELPGYQDKLIELITYYLTEKDVDTNRVYICGASMGGRGVWELIRTYPHLFTAAFIASARPVCDNPTDYLRIPICITVGEQERSVDDLRWMASKIEKSGGCMDFSILFGLRHPDACEQAFSAKRLKWLFSHTKESK